MRRRFFQQVVSGLAAATLLVPAARAQAPRQKQATRYYQGVRAAADWLRAVAVKTPDGLVWPHSPDDPDSPVTTALRDGGAGVVLFFSHLYRYTRNPADLQTVRAGADALYASIPRGAAAQRLAPEQLGLYTGLPGVAVALHEAFLATGEERYRVGARRALLLVTRTLKRTLPSSAKAKQAHAATGILSGYAGTGLFLTWAHRVFHDPATLDLATQLGDALLALAERTQTGLRWPVRAGQAQFAPDFAQGSAGVAYFLADLHQLTHEQRFLDAAEQAAEHLWAVASQSAKPGLLPLPLEEGGERFPLSWRHGPAGVGRLYVLLWKITANDKYKQRLYQQAQAMLDLGALHQRSEPGGDDASQCCGVAGVGEFFYGLAQQFGDRKFFNAATRAGDVLLQTMTRDERGGGAWFRKDDDGQRSEAVAHTGFLDGAAGVGLFLLRLDAALNDERAGARLPDWPFD